MTLACYGALEIAGVIIIIIIIIILFSMISGKVWKLCSSLSWEDWGSSVSKQLVQGCYPVE